MLRIAGIDFETDAAATTMSALLDPAAESLRWALSVRCRPKVVGELAWWPHLYHEALHFDARDWRELDGLCGEFPPKPSYAALRVFEHGEIGVSTIRLSRRRGFLFQVDWACAGCLYAGGIDATLVPVEVRGDVCFTGATVRSLARLDASGAAERLAAHLNLAAFEPPVQSRGTEVVFPPRVESPLWLDA